MTDFQRVLDLPVKSDDVPEARTVRDYLVALLAKLWEDQEGFDGKRPFGNSGWDVDLIKPLIRAGLIEGSFDGDGYLKSCDDEAGDALIATAIKHLGGPA